MKNLILFIVMSVYVTASAQTVSVNNSGAPADPSAILDVSASDKGLLIPRVTLTGSTDASTIPNAANALIVYNKSNSTASGLSGSGLYINEGTVGSPNWKLMGALPTSGIVLSELANNSTLSSAGFLNSGKIQLPKVISSTKPIAQGDWIPANNFFEMSGSANVSIGNKIAFYGLADRSGYINTGLFYDPVLDEWENINMVNSPGIKYYANMAWTGSKLIVWGGLNESGLVVNTGGLYDPVTKIWTTMSNVGMTTTGNNFKISGYNAPTDEFIVFGGGDPIVIGGFFHNVGYKYKVSTDTWTPMTNISSPRNFRDFSGCVVNGRILLFGGSSQAGGVLTTLNTGGIYEINNDKWYGLSSTGAPSARISMTCTATEDGRVLFWGGSNGATKYSNGVIYNTGNGTWEVQIPNAPISGSASENAYANGKWAIYASSGSAMYDRSTNSWATISFADLPGSRSFVLSGAANDVLFFYGGRGTGASNEVAPYYNFGKRYFTQPKIAVEQTQSLEQFYLYKKN